MPDCRPTDSIFITGERIRQAVFEVGIPHVARPSDPLFVTLSGGVASWTPGSPLSFVEVLEEADEALFQAKSDGRNRVYAAPSVDGCDPLEVGRGHHRDRLGRTTGVRADVTCRVESGQAGQGRVVNAAWSARKPSDVWRTNSSSRASSPRSSQVSVASTSQLKSTSARQASSSSSPVSSAVSWRTTATDTARSSAAYAANCGSRRRVAPQQRERSRVAAGDREQRPGTEPAVARQGQLGPQLLAQVVEDLLEDLAVELLLRLEMAVHDQLGHAAGQQPRRPWTCR